MGSNLWSFNLSICLLISNLFISCIRNTVLFRETFYLRYVPLSAFSKYPSEHSFLQPSFLRHFLQLRIWYHCFLQLFFFFFTNLISNFPIKSCIPWQFSYTNCIFINHFECTNTAWTKFIFFCCTRWGYFGSDSHDSWK